MDMQAFWDDVISQRREKLGEYFSADAVIRWHCTNEQFSAEEYIRVNCDYPGEWCGEIERLEVSGTTMIPVGHVFQPNDPIVSCRVVSFIRLQNDRIIEMDEYWADDGEAPVWRKNSGIGKPIPR